MKRTITAKDIIRFAIHHWKRHPFLSWSAVLLMAIAVTIDVFVPLVTGKIVDALGHAGTDNAAAAHKAWLYFGMFTVLAFLHHVFWSAALFNWNWFASHNLFNIVTEGMRKVVRFSAEWHANSFAGATVRKITRGMWSFDKFEDTIFFGFFPAFVVMIGMTCMLTVKLPIVGAFSFGMILLYVGFSVWMSVRFLAPRFSVASSADTKVGATLADMMTGISTIKAFASEEAEDGRFHNVATEWRKKSLWAWQSALLSDFLRSLIRMVLMTGMMGLTIWMWRHGHASAGDIALTITASFMIGGYMRDIGRHVNELQRSASEIEDAVGFWLHEDEIREIENARHLELDMRNERRGEIVFDRVDFSYGKKGRQIYDGLSVTIKAGEKVALVGLSGSGKSTFVKLIQRLYDIQGGEIRIDNQNIAHVTQSSLRKSMALVPQEPILFHRTLAENIAYGRVEATREEIIDAAKRAHAHEFITKLENGYETLVGERGVKLSGGERQRVAIARAILADCPILIMDEATSSLDSVSEHLIQKALEAAMSGRTTITVAHRLATIQKVDRILVFDQGRIIEEGTHSELLSRAGSSYRHLYEMQALDLVGESYN